MISQQIAIWTGPVLAFTVATLLALAIRHFTLRAIAAKPGMVPPVLLAALRFPSVLWCIAAGLGAAVHTAKVPPTWFEKGLVAFVIVSVTFTVAAMAVRSITIYGERNNLPFAIAGLSRSLIYIFVFSVGLLVLLGELNVQIAPILTLLGVGGLAGALALQDTLGNLFAGIHILVEEPISLGDYIELAEGQKGTVIDIGWRTTRIHTLGNNVLVIPNQKITSGILTNYTLRDARVVAEVTIMAAHTASPDRIAVIAMDAADATEGALKDPAPVVLFDPGVMTTHLQMKMLVYVKNVMDRGRVQSEARARIHEGFVREGIPFPEVKAG